MRFLINMVKSLFIMLKHFALIASILAISIYTTAANTVDSLLQVLDKEVARSDIYTARKQTRIDSLCAITPQTPELQLCIALEYKHFQSDSARERFVQLLDAEEPIRSKAFIHLVDLLRASGHIINALTLFESNNNLPMTDSESNKIAWLMYEEIIDNNPIHLAQENQVQLAQHYYAAMLEAYKRESATSEQSRIWYELRCAIDRSDWKKAISYSEQLLAMVTPEEHPYAILAYGHAMIYEESGNAAKRSEWLIRSAITDVRCGITDNGSSWIIAQDCYEAGDIRHAYLLSEYSVNNATFYNAPTRFIQNFKSGHLITIQHAYEQRKASIKMIVVLVLLAIALIVAIVAALFGLRRNRQLKALNKQLTDLNAQLKELDKVKEQYICRYLEVYSEYIRRLTTMARKAGEKNPTAFMNREMDDFYRSFDDTFLSLYGSFVEDFNALLKPEARIIPKPGDRMTIEMRIFALILLGITSSAKIAELLCYSHNTISNYRVKIKNACLGDRESFEQRIRQIGK